MDRACPEFDVFLSHNGEDKPCVLDLATRLKQRGIRVWLDAWELRPGLSWQEGLSAGLSNSSSCAALFGPSGYGGWHKREMEAALTKQGVDFPVIPVLLPGAPERASIGGFLSLLTWVDFRKGLDDLQAMHRLIWGITGLRATAVTQDNASGKETHFGEFSILNPRNGDLLLGPAVFIGTGPPKQKVFLHFRSAKDDHFALGASSETDDNARWAMYGPHSWYQEMTPGPYEVYAAGVQDSGPSQLVTVFYNDASATKRPAEAVSRATDHIEISVELHSAYLEATQLKRGQLLAVSKISGLVTSLPALALAAGEEIARHLQDFVTTTPLKVSIELDKAGRISARPGGVWLCYYAFPVPKSETKRYSFTPNHDFQSLEAMRMSQMAWRLVPNVDRIPANAFGKDFESTSMYLEVRHAGYRPEFVQIDSRGLQSLTVELHPVINKRIAVLDFPASDSVVAIPSFSQSIVRGIVEAMQQSPYLRPFGYFAERVNADKPTDFFEKFGRPQVEVGNEILTLDDVRAIETALQAVDTRMVSGEGRFVRRAGLDVHYLIRGTYHLFKQEPSSFQSVNAANIS